MSGCSRQPPAAAIFRPFLGIALACMALTPSHLIAAATLGPPAEVPPTIPSDAELQRTGAVIGEITIDNRNIFSSAELNEGKPLARLVNRLHVRTRPGVIRHQLLFRPGDRYSRRLLDESERILRGDPYFYDASIRPVRYRDGKVDVVVTTNDVRTFSPGIGFGRSGGINTSGVDLRELNFLGTGTAVSVAHSKGIDRSETAVSLSDAHAFDTWMSVNMRYSNNSDGASRSLSVDRPFYALDVRTAGGVSGSDTVQVDSLYDRGQVVDQFRDQGRFLEAYAGVSSGLRDDWVRRWSIGATYDEHRFATTPAWTHMTLIPEERKFVYPWVRFELVQDEYIKLRNRDQIGRTEDFYLGTTATVRLGWADTAFGSNHSALLFETSAKRGMTPTDRSTLLLSAKFDGRYERGDLQNAMLQGSIRYYAQQSSRWLFFGVLQGTAGRHLDLDNQLLLGGDNGLRGYPLRYQGGDARALLTLEQRYFSSWYLLSRFRIGGAVFFDTGRTWGTAPLATPSLGLLSDGGFGLRIGNSRSGFGNVLHVDLAFPFNGDRSISRVQLLVTANESF